MEARRSFAGHSRRHKTSRLVVLGEVLSRLLITIGGIGTIIAVALVFLFLVWVAFPLFQGASLEGKGSLPLAGSGAKPLRSALNDSQALGWTLSPEGTLKVLRLDNGHLLDQRTLFPGQKLTACSAPTGGPDIAFGFADGTVRLGRIGFTSRFLNPKEIPSAAQDLAPNAYWEIKGGLVSRTPEGQFRSQEIKVELDEPIKPTEAVAVQLIDLSIRPTGPVLSLLTADGKLRTTVVSSRENLTTGETIKELSGGELTLPPTSPKGHPQHLLVTGVGDNVYLIWEDGQLVRVNTQDLEEPKIVETVDLLGQKGLTVTAVQFQLGKSTLLVGDSFGRVRAWFGIKPAGAITSDGVVLAAAHELPGPGAAVTALATSSRTRIMAAGYADGHVRLFYVTSEKNLGESLTQAGQPVQSLLLAPKDDGLVALAPQTFWRWTLDPGYPEVTLASLFRPVWYEGYAQPTQVWQSSSGSDEFEPKFGLWPLVFGTLKATFYSLLLGVPLALMAAVYSSEFLHPSTRNIVKPTIEMMASLPSVVLGFLAALILAPFVEKVLPTILASFLTVPLAFMLGAYIWQLLPEKLGLLLAYRRLLFICAVLPLGVLGAVYAAPGLEHLFFYGNLKGWLAGQTPASTGGWAFLLLPMSALITFLLLAQVVNPYLRTWMSQWSRQKSALADLLKFFTATLFTLGLSFALGALLDALGFDPRGSIVGTYVQRNALVVGFMMGFAIIPIIYTIAEDALNAVPEHLRSASLGCGATPWQTAWRIIIPTAMSGLFSAVMVGLGRAVGETMIVLMATGNTPVMDLNIFNGFRTLSANIAVELPEAVRNSTHYRTLFFSALVLFSITFVMNTIAEVVRLRFRKRAYQL
jgi:phosphate transport system permease protein